MNQSLAVFLILLPSQGSLDEMINTVGDLLPKRKIKCDENAGRKRTGFYFYLSSVDLFNLLSSRKAGRGKQAVVVV